MRMKDKIGIVTAAASGMGRAGAVRFRQGRRRRRRGRHRQGRSRGGRGGDQGRWRTRAADRRRSHQRRGIAADRARDGQGVRRARFRVEPRRPSRTRGGRGHRHARLRPGHDAQPAHRADHHRDGAAGAARARRRLPAVHGLDLGPGRIAVLAGVLDGQTRRGRVRAGAGQAPWAREDPRQRHLPRPDRYADAARVRGTARPAIDRKASTRSSWCASAAGRTRSVAPASRRKWRTRRCSCCRTRPRSSRARRLRSTAAPPRSGHGRTAIQHG